MEFLTGICPKCRGELKIPEGHTQIICMYCGAGIDVSQAKEMALKGTEEVPVPKERQAEKEALADKAQKQFPEMLFAIQDPLKDFKKNLYEPSFRDYEKEQEALMDLLEDIYEGVSEPDRFLKDLASSMVKQVQLRLEGKNKRKQEELMMGFNMSLVIYVIPALIDHNKSSGRALAQKLLDAWKEQFPKTNLKLSDFDAINNGFKRRFCYITTAVCESLGKPDDCYELNLLREYRDGYLMDQPGGEEEIWRYYDIAPTIVKHIGKSKEAPQIYAEIWKDYLSVCIKLIERQEQEECRRVYQDMMDILAQKYFHQEEFTS